MKRKMDEEGCSSVPVNPVDPATLLYKKPSLLGPKFKSEIWNTDLLLVSDTVASTNTRYVKCVNCAADFKDHGIRRLGWEIGLQ